jgi:hypothetical protein
MKELKPSGKGGTLRGLFDDILFNKTIENSWILLLFHI